MPLTITIRFYEELNDFLPTEMRKGPYRMDARSHQNLKDIIESYGVPHGEVDLILANSESVDFSYKPSEGDYISVYPRFESLDISSLSVIHPAPLRETRFVLDVHLGKLARYLRMLGFDTCYRNDLEDPEIVRISVAEKRIILTRDIQLLKHGQVTHGYFIRSTDPHQQLQEVINRFDLSGQFSPFNICMSCNGALEKVKKQEVEHLLEPGTRKNFDEFYRCSDCGHVYWPGSHYEKMKKMVEKLTRDNRI